MYCLECGKKMNYVDNRKENVEDFVVEIQIYECSCGNFKEIKNCTDIIL